jgi:predicted ATPase
MIRSLSVERLRGIRVGQLEGLTSLTVFVGKNGCGKSTLLESLLIAAAQSPGDAIGDAIRRRVEMRHGARWLLWDAGAEGPARVVISTDGGRGRDWNLSLSIPIQDKLRKQLVEAGGEGPFTEVVGSLATGTQEAWEVHVGVTASNSYLVFDEAPPPDRSAEFNSWLVEARVGSLHLPLDRLYSRAAIQGRKSDVFATLAAVLPGFTQLEVLTEEDGTAALYMYLRHRERPVPVAVCGDGVIALVRLGCELSASVGGLLLLEEPELSQHPAAIFQSARVIHAAVRRGVQVILSTHSLEMIDALLATAEGEDVERLSVYRIRLDQGELRSSRHHGEEVRFAREQIGEDLR